MRARTAISNLAASLSSTSTLTLALSLMLTSTASIARPAALAMPAQDAGDGTSTRPAVIYVARRGWHIDIGFAVADLEPPLASLANEFPQAQSLFFGFGDRHYLESEHHAPAMFAALWPGRGLILATRLTSTPQAAFGAPHVMAFEVTTRQAREAQAFVWRSLADHQSLAAGPYEGSRYFAATARYSALHTCNTWAAQAFAAAALPVRSAGVIFAWQLWGQLRRLEKHPAAGERPMAAHRAAPGARFG
ncbi:MAG: DUF2459 domain-containing protein [Steroidobacteraceae bacterium]